MSVFQTKSKIYIWLEGNIESEWQVSGSEAARIVRLALLLFVPRLSFARSLQKYIFREIYFLENKKGKFP